MGGLIIDLKAANDLGTDVPQLTPQEPHQNLELALVIRVFEIIHKGSESNYESKPDSHAHHDELESLAMLKVLDRFLVGPNEDIKLQQSPWTHPLLMNCVGQQMWVHLVKYFYLWEWNNFSDSTIRKTVSTDIPRGLLVGKQEKSAEKIRMWHMPNKIVRELVSSYRNLLKDILLKAMETDVLGDVVVDFLVGVAVARDMEEVLRQRSSKRVELIQAGILKCPMDHFEEALEENTLLEKVDKKQQAQELTESELEKMQLSLADEEYHGVILHQWESLK